MGDLESRITGLTIAERALLEARLRQTKTQRNQLSKRHSGAPAPPLSFGQQRFWFIDQWEPGNPAYNTTLAFRLEGPFDPDAFDRSLTEVARRHEALRTTYAVHGEALVQVIATPAPATARRETAAREDADVHDPDALRLMTELASAPFDLRRGPLWRSALLQLAPQRHLLVLTLHHSVFDGWSTGVLARELFTLYHAFAAGEPSPLPELALQYGDFAVWQHHQLQGERLHRQVAYWRQQLATLATLDLPTDYVRPPKQTFAGAVHELSLPPALAGALRTLSRDEGATLFMTLLAAFQTLLHRYSGQTDLVVGTPIAGRTRAELEPLIGFFVNMLVLRTNAADDPSFRALLRQVRQVAIDAFAHQDVPFEKLVEALHPPRDPSRNPLFQVIFALQNAPRWAQTRPDLTVTTVDPPKRTTRFDLEVHVYERDSGLRALFIYNTALFTADTIGRFATHFHTLLDAIVRNPDQRLSGLPLLTPAERTRILRDWNQTVTDYPRHAAVHDLFQAQAQATPEAIAVVSGAEHLTYRQLNERANQLAHQLIALGVGPDILVAVCLERSIEMVVAVLATLKAGGAYVPLDPTYPRERLAFMLHDANVPVLLTDTTLHSRLPAHRASVVCLDQRSLERSSRQTPDVSTSATDLAYVIYTSGSTGQPKGVAVHHRGIVRLVRNTNYIQLGPGDRLTHVCNPCFDVATFEIWGALLNGSTLVIVPRDVLLSPSGFARLIQEENISTVFLPTALFHQIANAAPGAFHRTRDLLIAGEVCDPAAARRVLQAGAPRRLVNAYGPTESTTFTTYHCVDRVEHNALSVPIGRPISNTSVYILDSSLQPVPIGVVGELYIGGDGLAREYLNRPDLTAERFIDVSIDGVPDTRLYKSGDFAQYLPDGSIDFAGRIDGQVKIRGFRVELQEIEAALAEQPGVGSAVVISVMRGHAGVTLVAYVVPAPGASVMTNDVRNRLRQTLPEYMVPSAFVMVDTIPLTPNGKADRARLSARQLDEPAARSFEPPRTLIEEELADIWTQLLGVEQVGIHDNFFEIGGHSLLAVQVIANIEKRLGKTLPVALFFEFPTVAQLASLASEEDATKVAIERQSDATAPPLSFGQQRFWFIDQWEPGNPAYNTTLAFRLEGPFDPDAFDRSLTEVARRHEALRTIYAVQGEALVQVIGAPAPVTARRATAARIDADVHDPDALRLMTELASAPFDLRRGPLWRSALLQLAPQRHLLVLTLHHSVFDGWSTGVLTRELFTLYHAFAAGEPSPLPELALQYGDFAVWQHHQLQGERLHRQVAYWRQQLATLATLDLPTDYVRPPKQTFAGAVHELALPPALAGALRTLSRDEGATLFMTLLAAFQTLLHRYSGQTDLVVGTPIAGRTRAELEPLIGFFVNMLVLRTNAADDPSFRALLRQVRQVAIDAFAHQDVPFEKLVEALHPPRDPSRNPLFQVIFALQNAPRWAQTRPDLTVTTVDPPKRTTRFDLEVHVYERDSGLRALFIYNTALFTADTIGRFATHFHTLLDAIVRNPDQTLSQLPLLAPVTHSTARQMAPALSTPGETTVSSISMPVSGAAIKFIAPRTSLERQLARIWEELIGIAPIGILDNFFDLGGHSLLMVQIVARVEQRLGKTLPVGVLFQSPTVEQLAVALTDEQSTSSSSSLTPLNTVGSLPPFFWIHGDSSNVLLPSLLGPDRPLFALEHQAHDGRPARYTEVETIASHYLEEIRAVQLRGPYLLGGYSFGGVIAFEMAQQLSRRHEEVALLFLLDPSGRPANLREADGSENSNSTVLDIVTGPLRTRIRTTIQKVQHTAKMMRCKARVVTGSLLPPTLRSAYILDIYRKALRLYAPQPYSGRVSIYKTLSMEYSSPRDWPNLITGPLTIHDCEATHDALMKDPHIRNWAAKLKDGLTQADVYARASATIASTQGLPASAPLDS